MVAIWKIGQKLWTRDYGGGHEAIRGFDWSQEVQCLVAAFSGKPFNISSYTILHYHYLVYTYLFVSFNSF